MSLFLIFNIWKSFNETQLYVLISSLNNDIMIDMDILQIFVFDVAK